MNQRESSGLPLRAMVMVLLFLGVVFLLVAFQSMGSDDDSGSSESTAVASVTSTPTTTSSSAPAPAKPDVRVYNISEVAGAAEGVANRLRDAKWNVTETGNLVLEDVAGTTVYFGEEPGEREAADEVGKLLEAPVEPRRPELAEQPPGVIVVVTG
jgi:LytR cell envelope-related transcriptional attenuator